ncbi:hypothetical protein OIU77_028889 [Salix suchowensis]|uniref:Uncharacterized protein n=1 Tax=Salix suchowensis TaxID=1278906 RepID=A0ABQ9BJD0_9ROSI|nr:hypothetical protein OIU77_028889 [Salix suchowensis]
MTSLAIVSPWLFGPSTLHKSFPVKNFVDSSASIKYDVVATDFVSSNEASVQVDNGRLELEESGAFPGLETPGFLSPDVMESVMAPPTDVQLVPSETINIEGSSVGAFPSDNIVDSLSTHPEKETSSSRKRKDAPASYSS